MEQEDQDRDRDPGRDLETLLMSSMRLCELIASEVTRGIHDATPIIFGTVKEGIMEIMEERLRSFRAELAAGKIGTRTGKFPCSGCSRRVGRRSSSGSGTPLSADAR